MAAPINVDALNTHATQEYPVLDEKGQRNSWVAMALLTAVLMYSYWPTIVYIRGFWEFPQYSHGWLIPVFAGVLLWLRRDKFRAVPMWHRYVGLAILAAGIVMRVVATRATQYSFDNWSLIICGIGLFVMVGGLPTLRWAAPSVAFLVFMMPIPKEKTLTIPLQQLASMLSSYLLVTLGVDAFRDGTQITFGFSEEAMNVAEQCSGLRMLTIFSGLAVALALLSRNRPWWERVLIVLSALPIAVISNVIRITLTGLLFNLGVDSPLLHTVFHDAPGLIMMPIAIGLLYLEFKILSNLVIEEEATTAPVQFE
jgi:exosortase